MSVMSYSGKVMLEPKRWVFGSVGRHATLSATREPEVTEQQSCSLGMGDYSHMNNRIAAIAIDRLRLIWRPWTGLCGHHLRSDDGHRSATGVSTKTTAHTESVSSTESRTKAWTSASLPAARDNPRCGPGIS
jgi:hypothetical protein